MTHQPVTEFLRDLFLQLFDFLALELDHGAGFDIDQMIMVLFRRLFITRPTVAEIVPLQDARLFEQPDGAIDSGDRDARIDRRGALIDQLDIGVIG